MSINDQGKLINPLLHVVLHSLKLVLITSPFNICLLLINNFKKIKKNYLSKEVIFFQEMFKHVFNYNLQAF